MKTIKEIEYEFNIKIVPAKITGRRWTCIGNNFSDIILSKPNRIQVKADFGFIVYNWDGLSNEQKTQLKDCLFDFSGDL